MEEKKDIIKKGFDAAERERQEQEISNIKNIVRSILEKIDQKKTERTKLDKEIQVLKNDLEDLKSGRLDRIEERQQKEPESKNISIVIINRIEKEYIPYYPWRSPYIVTWTYNPMNESYGTGTMNATGTMFSNFTSGTYTVGDKNITL